MRICLFTMLVVVGFWGCKSPTASNSKDIVTGDAAGGRAGAETYNYFLTADKPLALVQGLCKTGEPITRFNCIDRQNQFVEYDQFKKTMQGVLPFEQTQLEDLIGALQFQVTSGQDIAKNSPKDAKDIEAQLKDIKNNILNANNELTMVKGEIANLNDTFRKIEQNFPFTVTGKSYSANQPYVNSFPSVYEMMRNEFKASNGVWRVASNSVSFKNAEQACQTVANGSRIPTIAEVTQAWNDGLGKSNLSKALRTPRLHRLVSGSDSETDVAVWTKDLPPNNVWPSSLPPGSGPSNLAFAVTVVDGGQPAAALKPGIGHFMGQWDASTYFLHTALCVK